MRSCCWFHPSHNIYHIYLCVSRKKFTTKILPKKLGATYTLVIKWRNFFLPPKYSTSDPTYHVDSSAEIDEFNDSDDDVYENNRQRGLCWPSTSSTSPQKPPTTYTHASDFGPHTDLIFREVTYTREQLICEYIWYLCWQLITDECCGHQMYICLCMPVLFNKSAWRSRCHDAVIDFEDKRVDLLRSKCARQKAGISTTPGVWLCDVCGRPRQSTQKTHRQ